MKKKVFILLAALSLLVATLCAQETTMYVMKNGAIAYQSVVSEVDSIIFYKPIIVPEDGVLINGVVWAKYNVGAPGTFVNSPEDAGMFYQWNRKIGWSTTNPMINSDGDNTWNSSVSIGDIWEKANDPCPLGWRMPTLQELQQLVDMGSEWDTVNGMAGRIFGTGSNSLFLPAAGYRLNSSGALVGAYNGNYWGGPREISISAYYLGFNIGEANVYGTWQMADGRSCRCVAE